MREGRCDLRHWMNYSLIAACVYARTFIVDVLLSVLLSINLFEPNDSFNHSINPDYSAPASVCMLRVNNGLFIATV